MPEEKTIDEFIKSFISKYKIKDDEYLKNILPTLTSQLSTMGQSEQDNPFIVFLINYAKKNKPRNSLKPITESDYIVLNNLYNNKVISKSDLIGDGQASFLLYDSSLYNKFSSDDFEFIVKFWKWFDNYYNVDDYLTSIDKINDLLKKSGFQLIDSLSDIRKDEVREAIRAALLYDGSKSNGITSNINALKNKLNSLQSNDNEDTTTSDFNSINKTINSLSSTKKIKDFIEKLTPEQQELFRKYLSSSNKE